MHFGFIIIIEQLAAPCKGQEVVRLERPRGVFNFIVGSCYSLQIIPSWDKNESGRS